MALIDFVKRLVKGSPLTNAEGDSNWTTIEDYMNSVVLPIISHDLDDYETPGRYHQASEVGAAAGSNYPVPQAGMLYVDSGQEVDGVTPLIIYQRYFPGDTENFSGYFRVKVEGVWGNWRSNGSQIAVGSTDWWHYRPSIPAGRLPYDGQTVSRATYPELTYMVVNGLLPVVAEATWQSNLLERGKYTLGDGSTTIRLPDFNGKSPGSRGAVFLRGDGALSAGTNGLIQQDAVQAHGHQINIKTGVGSAGQPYGQADYGLGVASQYGTEGVLNNARQDVETRALNVTGAWTVQAFGAVVNPGSLDAAQLAADLAALDNSIEGVIYYANGSSSSPATIITNTRYVLANPFPGSLVIAQCQINVGAAWFDPGWASSYNDSTGIWSVYGSRASQISTGQVILQTGRTGVAAPGSITGGGGGEQSAIGSAQMRLVVWKIKATL